MPSDLIKGVINAIKLTPMFIIDISHHQSKIDWAKVTTQNVPKIDGAFIKTSTGVGGLDERALYNATEAKKNGLKIGYYHYCSLNEEDELKDSTEEANWFIHVLKTLPPSDLPVALDIEDPQALPSLDSGEIYTWIKNFFSVLQSSGYHNYILYSFTPFLDTHLPTNHNLGTIPLWIAQYRSTLTLPKGWNSAYLWQYTDKGHINGISTVVDLNKQ